MTDFVSNPNPTFGKLSKVGFKIESGAYGVSKTIGANDQISASEYSISIDRDIAKNPASDLQTISLDELYKVYKGSLSIETRYNLENILAVLLGFHSEGFGSVESPSGVYRHFFEGGNINTRNFTHLEGDSGVSKVNRGTFSFDLVHSNLLLDGVYFNGFNFQSDFKKTSISSGFSARNGEYNNTGSASWTLRSGSRLQLKDAQLYLKPRFKFYINPATATASKQISITYNAVNYLVTIPDGNYDAFSLAEAMRVALDANGSGNSHSVYFNPINQKFRFFCDTTFTIVVNVFTTRLGFNVASTIAVLALADMKAQFSLEDFTSADLIPVSSFNFAFSKRNKRTKNAKDVPYIGEAYTESESLRGSFKIPRYGNNELFQTVNDGNVYEMKIVFTGALLTNPSYSEEFTVNFPCVVLENTKTSVKKSLSEQNIKFTPHGSTSNNPLTAKNAEYFLRTYAITVNDVRSVGNYRGFTYIATKNIGNATKVYQLTDAGLVDTGTIVTGTEMNPFAMKEYEKKLYIGGSEGKLYEYDGTTWAEVADTGTNTIVALEVYNNILFVLTDDGIVFEYTSTSFATSYDPSGTIGKSLVNYNGKLYAFIRATFNKVYEFNGAVWSEIKNFGATDADFSLCVFSGKLVMTSGTTVEHYDGSLIVTMGFVDNDVAYSYEFNQNLFFIDDLGNLSVYDAENGTDRIVYTTPFTSIQSKPFIHRDLVFFACDSSGFKVVSDMKSILIQLQNENSY